METTSKASKQRKSKTRDKSCQDQAIKKPKSYLYDTRNSGLPVFGVIVQWDAKKTYSTNALNTLFNTKLSTGQVGVSALADEQKRSLLRRKKLPYFRRNGSNKGVVIFKTMEEANAFSQKEDPDYYPFIPLSFVVVVGVVIMPASSFNFLGFKSAASTQEILKWRKQKLPDKKIKIIVSIRGTSLPAKLTIRDMEIPLEPYERKPDFCDRCLRYGHRKTNCFRKLRCGMCIDTKPALKHFESKCLARKQKPMCFYCREDHASGAAECSEYAQQCKYKNQLIKHNMSKLTLLEKEIIPAVRSTPINSSRTWLDSTG